MKFTVTVEYQSYFDDLNDLKVKSSSIEFDDVINLSCYVAYTLDHINGQMMWDEDFRDVHNAGLVVALDGEVIGSTEWARNVNRDGLIRTDWRKA